MTQRGTAKAAAGATLAALALATTGASSAQALSLPPGWELYETAGTRRVQVPAGVISVRVVAYGAQGGGVDGGNGAVVDAEVPVRAGQTLVLRIGRNGGFVTDAMPAGGTPAGTGGDATRVSICEDGDVCAPGRQRVVIVAAGGGGAGAGSALLPGGAGGDAGAAGAAGPVQGDGAPAGGGGAGTATAGGAGGSRGTLPDDCGAGIFGSDGLGGFLLGGGAGGFASDVSRVGGSGGDGLYGGGGGGSAASCGGVQIGGGAGGGGGSSLVPAGGTFEVLDLGPADPMLPRAFHVPSIRLFLRREATAPAITVSAPVEGGRYEQRAVVTAAYACADEDGGSGIESCTGTVAAGAPLDTATPGAKTFTVTAKDRAGNSATKSVTYTVTAAAPRPGAGTPALRGVKVTSAAFRFTLSAPASVTLRVERRNAGKRARWTAVGTLRHAGRRGANSVAFRGRVGRRALKPGTYRVTLQASASGRRSKAVSRVFVVRARPRR